MFLNSSNISKVDNLVICSLNVRGLSNEVERRETFNWLRNTEKILCLFFARSAQFKETEKVWLADWGYRGLLSSLSSSRAGISVLFNNNFSFEIQKYYEGRFIIVDIKTEL